MSNKKKQCVTCHKYLPATEEFFYARKEASDGLRGDCKACKVKNTLGNKASRE